MHRASGWDEHGQLKYTLIFRVTHMESGYNAGIKRKSSSIDAEVQVVETANPSRPVLKFRLTNCKGKSFGGYDFAANLRLMESFATAGDAVGKILIGKDIE